MAKEMTQEQWVEWMKANRAEIRAKTSLKVRDSSRDHRGDGYDRATQTGICVARTCRIGGVLYDGWSCGVSSDRSGKT